MIIVNFAPRACSEVILAEWQITYTMSKAMQRVVPWMCRSEFVEVYQCLYSENEASQRYGINKVALWRCRAHHKLPVAIDCTSVLVASSLQHAESIRSDKCQTNEYEIKLSHAMSLIRLVNHITEKGQTRQYAQSVHVLAAEYGLPEWLVDLRHDATHGDLPALDLLTEGVEWALDWLQREYWKKQMAADELDNATDGNETNAGDNLIQNLLVDFMQVQFNSKHQYFLSEGKGDLERRLRKILSEMEQVFAKNKTDVVRCIAGDGYLILTPEQLSTMDITEDTFSKDMLSLPIEITAFWQPVLQVLHRLQAKPLLLQALCEDLTEVDDLKNRIRAGWVFEILKSLNTGDKSTTVSVRNVRQNTCTIHAAPLIEMCLAKPSAHTLPLVHSFLENQGSHFTDVNSDILSLLRIYRGMCVQDAEGTNSEFSYHAVSDFASVMTQTKQTQSQLLGSSLTWQQTNSKTNWSCCPLGLLPNQKELNLTLEKMIALSSPAKKSSTSTSSVECSPLEDIPISEETVSEDEMQHMENSEDAMPFIELL